MVLWLRESEIAAYNKETSPIVRSVVDALFMIVIILPIYKQYIWPVLCCYVYKLCDVYTIYELTCFAAP